MADTDTKTQASIAWQQFVNAHKEEYPQLQGVGNQEELNQFLESNQGLKQYVSNQQFRDLAELNKAPSLPQEYEQHAPSAAEAFQNGAGGHEGGEAATLAVEGGAGLLESMFTRHRYMEDDEEYKNIRENVFDQDKKAYVDQRRKDIQGQIEQSVRDGKVDKKGAKRTLNALKDLSDDQIIADDVAAYDKASAGGQVEKYKPLEQAKRFTREGQLNYLYGSVDNDDMPEAEKRAREIYEKRLANSRWPWRRNKLKRYQRNRQEYQNDQRQYRMGRDPELQRFLASLNDEQRARGASMYDGWVNQQLIAGRKNKLSWNDFIKEQGNQYNALMDRIRNKTYSRFANLHPQQALRYAGENYRRKKNKTLAQGLSDTIQQQRDYEMGQLRPGFRGAFVSSPYGENDHAPAGLYTDKGGFTPMSPQAQQGRQNQRQSMFGRGQNLANRAKNLSNDIKNLQNAIKAFRAGAFIAQPWVAIPLAILILLLFIIIIIMLITSSPSDQISLPALRCDTSYSGDIRLDLKRMGWSIDGDIYNQQSISQLKLDPNTITQEQNTINEVIYNTVCEIYQVNDFKTKMGDSGNKIAVWDYIPLYKDQPDCSVRENDPSATQYVHNHALLSFFKMQNCTGNQMQFLIAQQVARVVANAMSDQELSSFASTISPDPRLTTPSCLKANIQTRPGQEVCFGDTIATFIVNNQSFSSASIGNRNFAGGLHGGWAVQTLAEAQDAYKDGITYIMPFEGSYSNGDTNASVRFADPSDPWEQYLQSHNMKTILDMHDLYKYCANEQDMDSRITDRINQVIKSPVLIGYWIRDDYNFSCPEVPTIQKMNTIIHQLDPTRPTIAGFGDVSNIKSAYVDGIADILAFYPYPAFSTPPETEVAQMLDEIKNKTQKDAPPYIGLYQAFYGQHYGSGGKVLSTMGNPRSTADILTDVDYYLDKAPVGAISVGAFGLAQFDWQHFIGSDPTGRLDQTVCSVSKKIGTHCTM